MQKNARRQGLKVICDSPLVLSKEQKTIKPTVVKVPSSNKCKKAVDTSKMTTCDTVDRTPNLTTPCNSKVSTTDMAKNGSSDRFSLFSHAPDTSGSYKHANQKK